MTTPPCYKTEAEWRRAFAQLMAQRTAERHPHVEPTTPLERKMLDPNTLIHSRPVRLRREQLTARRRAR